MLFLLFGASAAGKTSVLDRLRASPPPRLAMHDFDELGVPPDADTGWRQRANATWIERALAYQRRGLDLLLAGQTPFGELLASPSAPELDAISGCLLDCSDEVRLERLRERGAEWLERVPGALEDHMRWGGWMREHARDPQFMPQVIRNDASAADMRWDRWSDWPCGDPRWRVDVVDTSILPVERVADEVRAWIERRRRVHTNARS